MNMETWLSEGFVPKNWAEVFYPLIRYYVSITPRKGVK